MIDFKLKRGMNFDHHVSRPGEFLAKPEYFKMVKEKGFDHIRLPYEFAIDREGIKPCEEYYERIKTVTQMALDTDLIPIVDLHPLYGMQNDPIGMKPHLYKLWEGLSDYLKDMDERVIFEIYNEPDGPFDYKILNEVQNEVIKIIRKTNPTRLIAAASAHCNTIENLVHLELPEDDENIFVTVHEYTPMKFTHQGADWMDGDWPTGIRWGTDEEKQLLADRLEMAAEWGRQHNRRIHLGEFGAINKGDNADRVEWTRHIIRLCEEKNIAWCYWELCYVYSVYDLKTGEWNEKLLDALTNP